MAKQGEVCGEVMYAVSRGIKQRLGQLGDPGWDVKTELGRPHDVPPKENAHMKKEKNYSQYAF